MNINDLYRMNPTKIVWQFFSGCPPTLFSFVLYPLLSSSLLLSSNSLYLFPSLLSFLSLFIAYLSNMCGRCTISNFFFGSQSSVNHYEMRTFHVRFFCSFVDVDVVAVCVFIRNTQGWYITILRYQCGLNLENMFGVENKISKLIQNHLNGAKTTTSISNSNIRILNSLYSVYATLLENQYDIKQN